MTSKIFDVVGKRIWAAGHHGMVGSAVVRCLVTGKCEVLTVAHSELDLTRRFEVECWLEKQRPDAVIMAAARASRIHTNTTLPAEFLSINLMIGTNVLSAAHRADVRRLVNLGSSCMYPLVALGRRTWTDLSDGLAQMYRWYSNQRVHVAA